MSIEIVFEIHSLSENNERGIATGWLPGRLPARGRGNAAAMGRRRRDDGIAAVFTSDLRRAAQTAEIAFGDTDIPILYDWRLRECDFGQRNGTPTAERVLLIGHVATQRELEHVINGVTLEVLTAADFDWREDGWEYRLG